MSSCLACSACTLSACICAMFRDLSHWSPCSNAFSISTWYWARMASAAVLTSCKIRKYNISSKKREKNRPKSLPSPCRGYPEDFGEANPKTSSEKTLIQLSEEHAQTTPLHKSSGRMMTPSAEPQTPILRQVWKGEEKTSGHLPTDDLRTLGPVQGEMARQVRLVPTPNLGS